MIIQFRTAFTESTRAWYLFHKPIMNGRQSHWRQVANVFFHIITLGIPFLFYHAISYCLIKFRNFLLRRAVASLGDVRQELLDFACQKLSEETDIKDFDWLSERGAYHKLHMHCFPNNDDISRLATLYWDKYAIEFQDILKANSRDGEDPWTSEEVLDKAEEWLKISCSIMILTIDDIQSQIDQDVITKNRNKENVSYEIKNRVVEYDYSYAREALCYFWYVYTLLKIGVGWDNENNTWCLPEDVYSKALEDYKVNANDFPDKVCSAEEGKKLIKRVTNLRYVNIKGRAEFYQEGMRQAKWKKLYSDCHFLLHQFLRLHLKDIELVPLDSNKDEYEACAMYINWLK